MIDHKLIQIPTVSGQNSLCSAVVDVNTQTYRCDTCGQTWKTKPTSKCLGAKIYRWDPWPYGLYTRKQLAAKSLNPGPLAGVIPYEKSADGDGWLRLYRESEAVPKPELSPACKAALTKMHEAAAKARLCSHCGQQMETRKQIARGMCSRCEFEMMSSASQIRAGRAAYELVCDGDFVVWDSETTDLYGRFVELAVIDSAGTVLFDERIRPGCLITPGAYAVHGINDEYLASAPTFYDIYDRLRDVLHHKHWIIYNSDYDTHVLDSEREHSEYRYYFAKNPIRAADITCEMHLYAEWNGEWSDYHNNWRWLKLSHAANEFGIQVTEPMHSALGDCLVTLEVLYAMADWYRQEVL